MNRKFKNIFLLCSLLILVGLHIQIPASYAEEGNLEEVESDIEEEVESDIEEEVDDSEAVTESPTSFPTEEEVSDIKNMELMASNSHLELYFNEKNAEFAVKEKNNGYIWYSNPANRANDSIANPENKSLLSSQVILKFFDTKGQSAQFDTFKDSVNEEQFTFEKVENGFKIIYEIGKESLGIDKIPEKISEERFHSLILDKLDEDAVKDVEKRFKYVEEEALYERRDGAFSQLTLERTLEYFEEAGYTEEDLAFDNEEHESLLDGESSDPNFIIPLLVEIEDDQLVVTVDGEEIEYEELYPIHEMRILPFFGAADTEETGYIFVPDGSGALIELNNGKGSYEPYSERVYGIDETDPIRRSSRRTTSETIKMPVFGMKKDDHAFFGIIEEGDGIAKINADVSGVVNSYNSVSSSFVVKQVEEITLQGGDQSNTVYSIQKGDFKDTIKIRYSFLEDKDANYNGMAKLYQDYLIDNQNLKPLETQNDIPFFLELSGAIWKRKSILGIPYRSLQPLTTFEQGEEMVNELLDGNVNNIKLRYTGWFNSGIDHKIPTSVKVDRVLGGQKGLNEFNEFLLENEVELYPDVAFTNVYKNTFNFRPTKHASRFIRREVAERWPIDPATFRRNADRSSYYVLSPDHLSRSIDGFISDYEKLNINNVSLRDLGEKVNSDYREKRVINREQSKRISEEQLNKISEKFTNVMGNGGNAFIFPYAQEIVNVPMTSSRFNITDKTIPFYQMVIHGYINYAGEPINLTVEQNIKHHTLKSLETGSNIYFSWFYEDNSIIKDTAYNDLISANYKLWIDEAIEMYNEVNSVLKEVKDKPITSHNELAHGVFEVTYGNDLSIMVNYNDKAVNVDGIEIEAESYKIR